MGRALIIAPGMMRTAYNAGVVTGLMKNLGRNYFNAVYASSGGVLPAVFFASDQPLLLEEIVRERSHGKQTINWGNVLRLKSPLNQNYYIGILKNELDQRTFFDGEISTHIVVTDYSSGEPAYINPDERTLYASLKASSAFPVLASPVLVGDRHYLDGAVSDRLPLEKALHDGYDEVVVVSDKPAPFESKERIKKATLSLLKLFDFIALARLVHRFVNENTYESKTKEFRNESGRRIYVIRPSRRLPLRGIMLGRFDTDKKRLNQAFDIGLSDALSFVENKEIYIYSKRAGKDKSVSGLVSRPSGA